MSLVHIKVHQNSRIPVSTLTALVSLKVRLDAPAEHSMAEFLLSSETRNTMVIGHSDPHGVPIVSIHGAPLHSNIAQSIAYEITKYRLL